MSSSLRARVARRRARGRHTSTRGATVRSRVEFHAMGPLGVLNRGTERGGGDEARAPARLKRARRRTKLEVHGDVRTRPVSERLEKRKEPPSPTVPGALLSPFKAPRHVKAREGQDMSDSDRAAFAVTAHFATKTGQVAMTDLCREWGVSKTQGYEILKRWKTEKTVATKPRSGRPHALTDADM